jgi:hypothetical protein
LRVDGKRTPTPHPTSAGRDCKSAARPRLRAAIEGCNADEDFSERTV